MKKRKATPSDVESDPRPADILEAQAGFQDGDHKLLGRGVCGVVEVMRSLADVLDASKKGRQHRFKLVFIPDPNFNLLERRPSSRKLTPGRNGKVASSRP